jgi:hypothetical protein
MCNKAHTHTHIYIYIHFSAISIGMAIYSMYDLGPMSHLIDALNEW